METNFASRVLAGINFLDARVPGWTEEIDLETLNIDDLQYCILSQLFGGWTEGAKELGIFGDRLKQEDLGFELTADEYLSTDLNAAWELTHEWIVAIRALRKARFGTTE